MKTNPRWIGPALPAALKSQPGHPRWRRWLVTSALGVSLLVAAFDALAAAPGGVSADLQMWFKADAGTDTTTDGGRVMGGSEHGGAYSLAGYRRPAAD